MNYPKIRQAIEVIPDFKNYINIIKERSDTPEEDLQSLEFILCGHTVKQVYDFLPRFISLI